MTKNYRYLSWSQPQLILPEERLRVDQPYLTLELITKHFTETQQDFLRRRFPLYCPDMRVITKEQLAEHFHHESGMGGINDSAIIMAFIVQYYVRFREKKDGSVRGNLKSFWYRKVSKLMERLGRLESQTNGLAVRGLVGRGRYLLKTMEDTFEQLFRIGLYHYEDLDIYNQREKFQLYGRKEKRHLFYVEKEGMFWVCENVNKLHSCHAFASRGSGSWIDVDYLSKAISKLGTRTLYIAALTDYDPWGVFIAKQIRKKFLSELFPFRNVHLEILTTLDLYDPDIVNFEKRYLLANHQDPKDPVYRVVMRWVEAGGGINGEPYGMYSDDVNQERLMERVGQWIKGNWSNRLLSRMDVSDREWKAATRQMKASSEA